MPFYYVGFTGSSGGKESASKCWRPWLDPWGQEDPLEKGTASTPVFLVPPWRLSQQRICLPCKRLGFGPWVGKIPWRRKWQPTPVFLPGKIPWTREPGVLWSMRSVARVGHAFETKPEAPAPAFLPEKSHGQRSLVGYSPHGPKSLTRLSNFHFKPCHR